MSKPSMCDYNIIVTCSLGNEEILASYIEETCPEAIIETRPMGFKGLVLAKVGDPRTCANEILSNISFAEKVFTVKACVEADLERIAEAVSKIAVGAISENDRFAVRTVRRGSHEFSSIDVNVVAGKSIQEVTGARVDLDEPDVVVFINILGKYAFISIERGVETRPKGWKRKFRVYELMQRTTIVQEPYISPDPQATYKMGERIGRAVQTYEVGRYIIALTKPVNAILLAHFIRGLEEGIESRFNIQRKSYSRKVIKTQVQVYEMHLLIRSMRKKPVIVFEPEGSPLSESRGKVLEIIRKNPNPVLVFGARDGVPTGLFRFADIVVDVAPGITLSTDQAIPTALGALINILGEQTWEETG